MNVKEKNNSDVQKKSSSAGAWERRNA